MDGYLIRYLQPGSSFGLTDIRLSAILRLAIGLAALPLIDRLLAQVILG